MSCRVWTKRSSSVWISLVKRPMAYSFKCGFLAVACRFDRPEAGGRIPRENACRSPRLLRLAGLGVGVIDKVSAGVDMQRAGHASARGIAQLVERRSPKP